MSNNFNNENEKNSLEKNNLIVEILKIDEIAQKKLAKEKELENENFKKNETKKQKMLKKMDDDANAALNRFLNFKKTEFENKLKNLNKTKEKIIEEIKQKYEKNELKWVKQTISEIIEK